MNCRVILLLIVGLFGGLASSRAIACTEGAVPQITSISRVGNTNSILVQWTYGPTTFCIWPEDFYQVRWTQGFVPSTQNQAKIDTNQAFGSFTLNGANPNQVFGFIVQACKSSFLAPANCTGWSPMRFFKPFGPQMCRLGFVWRGAFAGDLVCVTPQTRRQAALDNAAAPGRVGSPPPNCKSGFVWRAANPSDLVCVTPATRTQAAQDNAAALSRILP